MFLVQFVLIYRSLKWEMTAINHKSLNNHKNQPKLQINWLMKIVENKNNYSYIFGVWQKVSWWVLKLMDNVSKPIFLKSLIKFVKV